PRAVGSSPRSPGATGPPGPGPRPGAPGWPGPGRAARADPSPGAGAGAGGPRRPAPGWVVEVAAGRRRRTPAHRHAAPRLPSGRRDGEPGGA
ncbi:hypothetical protein EF902_45060, partial [Streptomyces sp. WAC05858]